MAGSNVNVKAVISAEDRSQGVLSGFSAKVDAVSDQVASSIRRVVTAFGAAATAATGFALKSAADFEQTRLGLENMLGSADKARALLEQISKFAAETPFEFPELAQATRQLIAFGFSADDAFDTMKQLGDISAAIGAPINDLAYLMGTLRVQGRAFTIDIRQFAQRGIPIYEYLAKVLKTNEKAISEMIEAGKVGFPEVQKAFELMTSEGGKFHGTMAKQSKSLSGLFSTLKDNIGQAAREMVGITQGGDVRQGSLFDRLRTGATWLIDNLPSLTARFNEATAVLTVKIGEWARAIGNVASQIANYLGPKLEELWGTFRDRILPAIAGIVRSLGPDVGAGLVWAVGLAVDALTIFLQIIAPILEYLRDHTWIIVAFVGAIAAIKTVLLIDAAVKGFIAQLALLNGAVSASTGMVGGLRLALLLLTNPITITLGIVGVAAVIASIEQVIAAIDKMKKKFDDMKNTKVSTPAGDVSGTSDLGLTAQLRRFLGGRAKGGPVMMNTPYIVGEEGPEIFVPERSGNIVPNNKVQNTPLGSAPPVINITVQAGAFVGTQVEARKFATMIMDAYKDAMAVKGMTV